ncbi:Hypothetical predicted protein [Octopus vulgaris]|uniref:Uncharacterized protein n=1 Tax=Octopus vulgaris TaxID=6645 RepID=A0AA36BA76_OCTVU|nr:Hypothetical predicted protein [Octopus vulgaris]
MTCQGIMTACKGKRRRDVSIPALHTYPPYLYHKRRQQKRRRHTVYFAVFLDKSEVFDFIHQYRVHTVHDAIVKYVEGNRDFS